MGKQSWLDALYNHPRRDEILTKYIQSYYWDSKLTELKSVEQKLDENGDPILDVTYENPIYMSIFGCCLQNDIPLTIHLMIGEYYVYEHQSNKVLIHGPLLKHQRQYIGKRYQKDAVSPKEYIFNGTGKSGKDLGERFKVDGYSYGLCGHFMMKILETLNRGVEIDGESYADMLRRKTLPILETTNIIDPDNADYHTKRYNDYFDRWLMPIGAFLNMPDLFPEGIRRM